MKISIITSTYNREIKLRRSVKSVLNQTYKNWEYHIIDDGSNDNTSDYLKSLSNNEKFTIYSLSQNNGQPTALFSSNVFNKIKGDLVIILDSDDYLLNNAFEIIIKDFNYLGDKNILSLSYDITNNPSIIDSIIMNNFDEFNSKEVLKDSHPINRDMVGFRDYFTIFTKEYWLLRMEYFNKSIKWYVSKYDMNINNNFKEYYSNSTLLYMDFESDTVTKGSNFKKYAPTTLFTREYIFENYANGMDPKLLEYTFFSLLMTKLTFKNNKYNVLRLILDNLNLFVSNKKKTLIILILIIMPYFFNYYLKYFMKKIRLKR